MRLRVIVLTAIASIFVALGVWAVEPYNTSGRWACKAGDCVVGHDSADSITWNTDGSDLDLDTTSANTLTLTTLTTASPTFTGADAATPATTIYDTTGAGTVTVGSADVTSISMDTDGADLGLDVTGNALTLTATTTASPTFLGADAATPADTIFDTTGAGTVQVGSADVTGVIATTDGAGINLEGTTPNALTLSAATTGTATFQGADAAGAANTALDTTGAGTVTIGSADVTSIPLVSDAGTVTIDGDVTLSADATGGDAGAVNQFIGVPRIKLTASATDESIDGTGATFVLMDDSPIGEAAPITGGTEAAETTIFRVGAGSYKYTWAATVADNHGIDFTVTGHANAGSDSLGFWLRSDTTFASGDLDATLDDGTAAEGNAVVPAYSTANVWQWMEVDFAADCDATCADVDGVFIQATAQAPTDLNDAVMYFDAGAVWIDTAEVDLNLAIQTDGVLGVVASPDAEAGEQDFTTLVEWTSYFPHYESGNDFLVAIDDQSANTWMILVAY